MVRAAYDHLSEGAEVGRHSQPALLVRSTATCVSMERQLDPLLRLMGLSALERNGQEASS